MIISELQPLKIVDEDRVETIVLGQLEVEVACDRIRGIFRLEAIP